MRVLRGGDSGNVNALSPVGKVFFLLFRNLTQLGVHSLAFLIVRRRFHSNSHLLPFPCASCFNFMTIANRSALSFGGLTPLLLNNISKRL